MSVVEIKDSKINITRDRIIATEISLLLTMPRSLTDGQARLTLIAKTLKKPSADHKRPSSPKMVVGPCDFVTPARLRVMISPEKGNRMRMNCNVC